MRHVQRTVDALETGRYDPSLPLAFRIAALFSASIEQVFFPDDVGSGDGASEPAATSAGR